MPPPLAPHLQVQPQAHQQMAGSVPAANHEPKSFLAKLLKRSPRPQTADVDIQKAAISSGSLFNKNFAIGAVTGLLAGAFVLPMIVNMFGGGKAVAAQTQAQLSVPAVINTAPAAPTSGETFIDAALAADAP